MPRGGYRPGRKPSTGRPSKGDRKAILVRLPADVAAEVERIAAESDQTVSGLVAGWVLNALAAGVQGNAGG